MRQGQNNTVQLFLSSQNISLIIFIFFLSGCVSLVKKSPQFDSEIAKVKTIAIMPADIEVYQLTAGGVRELMDDWSDQAQKDTADVLKKHLAERYGFKIKFIDEEWFKEHHKELWNNNRALYNAVALSALFHAYPGPNAFPYKQKEFDYTLGAEIRDLAEVCEADALLFVNGVDHEATTGRKALFWWNLLTGMPIPINPTSMNMGLVNGQTGNVQWFNVGVWEEGYSFRNKKHIDDLIEWFTRDFLIQK